MKLNLISDQKYCIRCKAFIHIKEFGNHKNSCKSCHNSISRAKYKITIQTPNHSHIMKSRRRRAESRKFIQQLKSNPYIDCKQIFHYCQMDRSKSKTITNI